MPSLIVPNSWGSSFREANDCHLPAGQPTGGQFCSKTGGAGKVKVPRTKAEAWKIFRQASATMRHYNDRGELEPIQLPDRPPRKRPGQHDRWDVTGVPPEMVKSVEEHAQHNLDANPLFREMTDTFGGYAVFTKVTPQGENEVTGRYEGGAGVTIYDNYWTRHAMGEGRLQQPEPDPKPGEAVAAENFAAVIRHEYGHYIEAAIRSDEHAAENRAYLRDYYGALRAYEAAGRPGGQFDFDAIGWHQRYREEHPSRLREFNEIVKDTGFEKLNAQVSYYAAYNFRDLNERSTDVMTETFAEAFTHWTNPRMDRSKFGPDANRMFDWFDKHLRGYKP